MMNGTKDYCEEPVLEMEQLGSQEQANVPSFLSMLQLSIRAN